MNDILKKIILHKRKEVLQQQAVCALDTLYKAPNIRRDSYSFKKALLNSSAGIIAEFKRQSPSKGLINGKADLIETTQGYQRVGAAALSVLTDTHFFGGYANYISEIRHQISIPILRKDFIIDTYQIVEAKAIGADVILLIAACLTPSEVVAFTNQAHDLGLEVLLEIHSLDEYKTHFYEKINVLGVNNRNLKTFQVDIQQSIDILPFLPKNLVRISESGIAHPETIVTLREAGFDGFLIGETFMNTDNPSFACEKMIEGVRQKSKNEV